MSIKSFKNKHTEAIFYGEFSKKIPEKILQPAFRKLRTLHAVIKLQDLDSPPGNYLEKLSGDRKGYHSIRINQQYRICFYWGDDNNVYDVEIVDYH